MQSTPREIDANTPSPARLYDYMLGGTDNYEVDRQIADQLLKIAPELRELSLDNRSFLTDAVEYCARQGIRQFLDIGSGLPTQKNVHEAAQSVAPDSRTVYVDNDPSVLPHAQTLIQGDPQTVYIEADARDYPAVLRHPETARMLDFTKPVAVLLVAVVHFIDDSDDPYGVVAGYADQLCPGSYVILAHVTSDDIDPELGERMFGLNSQLRVPLTYRTKDEVTRFFDGLELVGPGVIGLGRWSPDGEVDGPKRKLNSWCGVARKV
ncbi:SAM-dependent methyltransferase [Microtetraspora sp. AC03309]|uniref:SAM-dependent methyltransferase n=1 Tax=Microtetraspora sp. AC03309 TaxID=2779376 RepID=UPI0035B440C1|nr:SAM-dependent methyltransferase [Microtetraspora sp. AC03309]